MAEQRQPFRFRLPWLPAAPAAAPRPDPVPQEPSQSTPAPAAPAPTQRRPFRPAGVAPAQPPARAESQPRATSQPPSQTRTTTPSQVPPASPTRVASQARVTSQTASPARRVGSQPQPQTAPQSPSPSRLASQPPSQSRATPQPLSQTRTTTPSRAPPASPTHAAPQTQVTTQPASPARRVRSPPQPQTAPQSLSPSRLATQPPRPKVSASPPPAPSQAARKPQPETKPQSPPKKAPTTLEISQPLKKPIKQDILQPPSQEAQPSSTITTPRSEKVLESIEGQEKKPDFQDHNPRRFPWVAKGLFDPEYKKPSEEPRKMRGVNHEEPREKNVIGTQMPSLKAERKDHPLAVLDERGQHPDEEVYDGKEEVKRFRIGGRHNEADVHVHEKENRSPRRPEMAQKEVKGERPTFVHKLGVGRDNKHPALHEKPFSIITLTGENTGATMHLSSEVSKRERPVHIHRGYKLNHDESLQATNVGENSEDSKVQEELATKQQLYVNNNAQGINNSLVFNSSVTERNPGTHVVHRTHKPADFVKPGKERERETVDQARKSEVATTQAQRLAYAPTSRRRCLRGLFMESSGSDPEKPRRHGCRVGCDQKSKDDTINVL